MHHLGPRARDARGTGALRDDGLGPRVLASRVDRVILGFGDEASWTCARMEWIRQSDWGLGE